MAHADHLDRIEIASLAELGDWLAANHDRTTSVWLITHRKRPGAPHVPYDAIVEELLAWGWVDSLPRKLDEHRTMLLISPRRPGSAWSAINKARVEKLVAEGRLRPPGAAVIARSQADGGWSALDAVEDLAIPPDLAAALADHPPAEAHFSAFPRSTRRAILEWIALAKRPETRAARILRTATEAAANRRANQYRPVRGQAEPPAKPSDQT